MPRPLQPCKGIAEHCEPALRCSHASLLWMALIAVYGNMDDRPSQPIARVSPKTILIVDDDPVARKVVAAMVEQLGFAVLQTGSGRQALRILTAEPVDAVLLDVVMPDSDGIDILLQIKANPHTEGLPVIMLTGHADRDMRLSVLASGADDLLAKPADPLELSVRLRNVLRARSATAASGALAAAKMEPATAAATPRRLAMLRGNTVTGRGDATATGAIEHNDAAAWRAVVAVMQPSMLTEIAPRIMRSRPDGMLEPALPEAHYVLDLGADIIARERMRAAIRAAASGERQELRCVLRTFGMTTLRIVPVLTHILNREVVSSLIIAVFPDR